MKIFDFINFGDNFYCKTFKLYFSDRSLLYINFGYNNNDENHLYFTANGLSKVDKHIEKLLAKFEKLTSIVIKSHIRSDEILMTIWTNNMKYKYAFCSNRDQLPSLKGYDLLDFSIKEGVAVNIYNSLNYHNTEGLKKLMMNCSPLSNFYLDYIRNNRESVMIYENYVYFKYEDYEFNFENYDELLRQYCLSKGDDEMQIKIIDESDDFVLINFNHQSFSYQDYLTLFHDRSVKKIVFDVEQNNSLLIYHFLEPKFHFNLKLKIEKVEPIFHQDVENMIKF